MWLFYVMAALIALIIVKDSLSVIKYYACYKSQGMPFRYVPIIGVLRYFLTTDKKDSMAAWKALGQCTKQDEGIVAINHPYEPHPSLLLTSPEIVKEFCEKDNEFCDRILPLELPVKIGFLMQSGEHALKKRRIFSKFFLQKHLNKITPLIEKITIKKFEFIKKDLLRLSRGDAKKFQKIDLQEYWKGLSSELVNGIMFGANDYPKVDGMTIPNAIRYLLRTTVTEIDNHPLNLIFFMMPSKLGLLPQCKPMKELYQKIEKACLDMYKKRSRLRPEERGCNLVDLMVENNLNCPEDEILDEENIIGNLFLFQIAGMDTSRQVATMSIHHLSKNPHLSSQLYSGVVKDLFKNGGKKLIGDMESLEKSVFLNKYLKEALRIFAPTVMHFPRRATRNFKLGKYKIYKGDFLVVAVSVLHYDPNLFEDPKEFKVDRFSDSQAFAKASRNCSYVPFSSGNRGCIGKYLANIFMKVGLSHFIKEFEVTEDEEFDPKMEFGFTSGYKECWVKLRPRSAGSVNGDSE